MRETVKIIGFVLLLAAAFLIGRAYSAYCKRRTLETESFYALLVHISEQITLFLSTPKSFLSEYTDGQLENSGFLAFVREGGSMADAFEKSRAKLALSEETEKKLSSFFSEFGRSYKDGELKRCELFCRELSNILAFEREEEGRRIRLGYTLLFSSALAVIILLF